MKNYRNLLKKTCFYSIYPLICLFVVGCSEFDNAINEEFNNTWSSRCMEKYDKNPRLQLISRSDVLSYCDCVADEIKGYNNRIQYSKIFNKDEMNALTEYCIEREINF